MSAETSVTVVGAGATGGYLAAQLAKAGVSVTLVARADSLRQIRSSGITLERPDGERETIRPQRVLAANEIEHRADLVLFCVKSYDTEAAAKSPHASYRRRRPRPVPAERCQERADSRCRDR